MVSMEDVRRAIDPEEPDYVRAAGELGPDALPFLAELASSEDAMIASKAVSLAGLIGGEGSIPIVEIAAEAGPPEVRVVAAVAAGRLGGKAERALLRLLEDEDLGVRKYAVRAVPKRATGRLRDALEQMAESESDPSLRRHVRESLTEE